MKKLFGIGRNKKKHKKRLSPSDLAAPDAVFQATSPMYEYARSEFAQAVASGTSNDDGRGVLFKSPSETPCRLFANSEEELLQSSLVANVDSSQSFNQTWMSPTVAQHDNDQQSYVSQFQPVESVAGSASNTQNEPSVISKVGNSEKADIQQQSSNKSMPRQRNANNESRYQPPLYKMPNASPSGQPARTPRCSAHANAGNDNVDQDYLAACSASNLGLQESLFSQTSSSQYAPSSNTNHKSATESNNYYSQYLEPPLTIAMPDATYEEEYGDAYIAGPIKYIYPSGYQSMRPRSGPWKLSIIVCISFTWLSIFIVGHCSDRVDSDVSQYNQNEIDDDTLVIETRWCGSRLLYMMWVISMLVTGLAAAYCSIIGYIKVRDFAVANSRSQPPGMVGKTDFYAQIDDATPPPIQQSPSQASFASSSHRDHYHVPIYQSDGNPQFWGGHIYRPTQAAVAITSR